VRWTGARAKAEATPHSSAQPPAHATLFSHGKHPSQHCPPWHAITDERDLRTAGQKSSGLGREPASMSDCWLTPASEPTVPVAEPRASDWTDWPPRNPAEHDGLPEQQAAEPVRWAQPAERHPHCPCLQPASMPQDQQPEQPQDRPPELLGLESAQRSRQAAPDPDP
jgi:hypothetical protein